MNDLVEKIFPIRYLNIVKKYIVRVNKIINEYDVVIFMARKAICFYDALVLQKYIKKNSDCCIISSRALDYNILENLKNKKIALIDDFVVRGTSITKSMLTLQSVGIEPDIFIAACEEKFIEQESCEYKKYINKTFVELSNIDICKIAEYITEFIEASMCPYNIDQPIYKIKFKDFEDAKKFIHNNRCTDITSDRQKRRGIVNKVIHFNSKIFSGLDHQETNINGLYIKLRLLYKNGQNEVIILPFIVLPEITYQKLDTLYELIRTPVLDNILNNKDSLLIWENKLNLFQYIFSNLLILEFLKESKIEDFASKIRSNELAQFSKCLFDDEQLKLKISNERIFSDLLYNEEYVTLDIFAYNTCLSYAYDYIFASNGVENSYISANENVVVGKFLTCEALESYINRKLNITDSHVISNLIDIFIDRGIFVPVIAHTKEQTIIRGYRCGEVAKLTEDEMSLFAYALGAYLDNISGTKDYLDKIEFEKLCVLFFRKVIQKVFAVASDTGNQCENNDYYEIAYAKFGPRVSLAKGKSYSVGKNETLADEMVELLLIGLEKRSGLVNGEMVDKYVIKDQRKSFPQDGWVDCANIFAYDLYHTRECFLKCLKYSNQKWKKYVPTYNKFLTLLSIGNNEREQMLSLVAEINLFYSVKVNTVSIKETLKRILAKYDGICSGVWKYSCFKDSPILTDVFDEIIKYNKDMARTKVDYVTSRTDKNKEITDFINECGDFLVCVAYFVFILCKKYNINSIENESDYIYFFDERYKNIITKIDHRDNTQSVESQDLDDIIELKREAASFLDICDIFLEENAMNVKRYSKVFVLYSVMGNTISEWKEHNKLIENKNINAQKYNYIVIEYIDEISFEEQLDSIFQRYIKDNTIKIIFLDFDKEYEGVFISSMNIKGRYFDELIGKIIQDESKIGLSSYTELIHYSTKSMPEKIQEMSMYRLYEDQKYAYACKKYNIKKFYILNKKEKNMNIQKIKGKKVIVAENYIEKSYEEKFEILDEKNLKKLKDEIIKFMSTETGNSFQNISQQVLEGIEEKSESKIRNGLKILLETGKDIFKNVASSVIITYINALGILPPV